ncbi:hypothetical protein [Hydrogenophaga taeniospiralis]|nr:hypothetical protein [Hydrogenophaga taeniospiralis]
MAKPKSTSRVRRGDPEFERDYLLRMGLVKAAGLAPLDWSAHLGELQELLSSCEFLLPVAEVSARPGNAPEVVALWLKAVAATARIRIANCGGMGAVAPMVTQEVDSQLINTRK